MATYVPRISPKSKFSKDNWRWEYNPKQERWETYRNPFDWPFDLYKWLWDTFEHPGTDPDTGIHSGWDYYGGWIYLYKEEFLLLFNLRWP
jgi:hypothetical protein